MDINDALQILNKNFKYKPEKRDSWKIVDDSWEGDCDSYATTLLWLYSDCNILKYIKNVLFKASFLYCSSPNGVGHLCISIDNLVYDNIQKTGKAKSEFKALGYKFKYTVPGIVVLLKMVL